MEKNKSIIILGATGMLGCAVFQYFVEKTEYNILFTTRKKFDDVKLLTKTTDLSKYNIYPRKIIHNYFEVQTNEFMLESYINDFVQELKSNDIYMINCIGLIKPYCDNKLSAIKINSEFPLLLAQVCDKLNIKLIQIGTDCVFNGKKGKYTENDVHDANDVYGITKSLGESNLCMLLRTSIIGQEIKNFNSLLEWTKKQTDKVSGYVNHYWNGMTTKEFSKVCHQIIQKDLYKYGVFHLYSKSKNLWADEISKEYLVSLIKNKFNLSFELNKYEAIPSCERSLRTNKNLLNLLKILSIEEQIEEL